MDIFDALCFFKHGLRDRAIAPIGAKVAPLTDQGRNQDGKPDQKGGGQNPNGDEQSAAHQDKSGDGAAEPIAERIYVVDGDRAGMRVDRFLGTCLKTYSRSGIVKLLKKGGVRCNRDTITIASARVKSGDRLHVFPMATPIKALVPRPVDMTILFEDDDVVVIDKPSGLVTHPGAGQHDITLVHGLLHHCRGMLSRLPGDDRPGIIHRLDRDTSGVMVAVKSDRAYHCLTDQWRGHAIERRYRVFVWGTPTSDKGTIDARIGRSPVNRKKMAVVDTGKAAVTDYRLIRVFASGAMSLLDCYPRTGRTHQIRVHLTHARVPVIGDKVYKKRGCPAMPAWRALACARQALHAAELSFCHPNGKQLRFVAPLPSDLADLHTRLKALS